jgi:drug/metabolite transporter (DMT)-like permease
MQNLLEIADKIPLVMAPAIVILATIVISVLTVLIRLLEPASKAMLIAVMLAMSGWAFMMRAF